MGDTTIQRDPNATSRVSGLTPRREGGAWQHQRLRVVEPQTGCFALTGRTPSPDSWPTHRISWAGSGSTLMLSPKNTGSRRGLISWAGGLWKREVAYVEKWGGHDLYTTPSTENRRSDRQTSPHPYLRDPMRVGPDYLPHAWAPRWDSSWVRWTHPAPRQPQYRVTLALTPSQNSQMRCLWL